MIHSIDNRLEFTGTQQRSLPCLVDSPSTWLTMQWNSKQCNITCNLHGVEWIPSGKIIALLGVWKDILTLIFPTKLLGLNMPNGSLGEKFFHHANFFSPYLHSQLPSFDGTSQLPTIWRKIRWHLGYMGPAWKLQVWNWSFQSTCGKRESASKSGCYLYMEPGRNQQWHFPKNRMEGELNERYKKCGQSLPFVNSCFHMYQFFMEKNHCLWSHVMSSWLWNSNICHGSGCFFG